MVRSEAFNNLLEPAFVPDVGLQQGDMLADMGDIHCIFIFYDTSHLDTFLEKKFSEVASDKSAHPCDQGPHRVFRSSLFRASRSVSTIISMSSLNPTFGFHPRSFPALEASPIRRSTSAGRMRVLSTTTCLLQSRPRCLKAIPTSSLTVWVSPV